MLRFGFFVCVCVYTSVYAWRWMCDNWRAEGHLGPLHNNYVSTGHTHTHTQIQRGPLLFMHGQSIMHFCAFTHRWQDNRITEKRIWNGRICQDCGNSQIPSYTTKRLRKSSFNSPILNTYTQGGESIVSPSFSELDALMKIFLHLDCMPNICMWKIAWNEDTGVKMKL